QTVVSSSDDKNGEVAGSGGIWPDAGSQMRVKNLEMLVYSQEMVV
nr:hypothetical protein [Tanacetum cinerariifolium]